MEIEIFKKQCKDKGINENEKDCNFQFFVLGYNYAKKEFGINKPQKDIDQIINLATTVCGISVKEMFKSRKKRNIYAKMIIAYNLRRMGYSLSYIGSILKIQHAAVINLLKRYGELSVYDREFKDLCTIFIK